MEEGRGSNTGRRLFWNLTPSSSTLRLIPFFCLNFGGVHCFVVHQLPTATTQQYVKISLFTAITTAPCMQNYRLNVVPGSRHVSFTDQSRNTLPLLRCDHYNIFSQFSSFEINDPRATWSNLSYFCRPRCFVICTIFFSRDPLFSLLIRRRTFCRIINLREKNIRDVYLMSFAI